MRYTLNCVKTHKFCNGDFLKVSWEKSPSSSTFVYAEGNGREAIKTSVKTSWDDDFLYVRFRCEDSEIMANMVTRDEPLYDEEVVEVFLAPTSLEEYFEFNLSPRNVVFDSLIKHDGKRHHGHPEWNCLNFKHKVIRANPKGRCFGDWYGYMAIPFKCLDTLPKSGSRWNVNFYRIKRVGGEQYLAWSPTLVNPAYFHVPSKFGTLVFV